MSALRDAAQGLVTVLALAACKVLPPPPLLAPHAATAADDEGTTTAMIVVGFAGQLLFGGDGLGVALRVEHQLTDRTTAGVELTGGRGDQAYNEDKTIFRHWLVGLRGYGRFSPTSDSPIALLSGAGLSLTASGLVTGTLNAGVAIAYDNGYAVPVGTLGVALAVPLRSGRPYSEIPTTFALGPPEPGATDVPRRPEFRVPVTEVYLAGGFGLLVPIGDTGNRLSADLSIGKALRDGSGIMSFTLGDAQRFER